MLSCPGSSEAEAAQDQEHSRLAITLEVIAPYPAEIDRFWRGSGVGLGRAAGNACRNGQSADLIGDPMLAVRFDSEPYDRALGWPALISVTMRSVI